jgi:molecular chaperone IbpA
MTMRAYDFSPLFRYSVGFDRMQRLLDSALERSENAPSYPPYNIESVGENAYRITMAVAGFGEDDLDVTVKENQLTVSGRTDRKEGEVAYLHRGIATRAFDRRFDLADHVKVTGANLANGMLTISLERQVPEEQKPRKIDIKRGTVDKLVDTAKKFIGADEAKAA